MARGTQGAANVVAGSVKANRPALSRRTEEVMKTPMVVVADGRGAPVSINAFAKMRGVERK